MYYYTDDYYYNSKILYFNIIYIPIFLLFKIRNYMESKSRSLIQELR